VKIKLFVKSMTVFWDEKPVFAVGVMCGERLFSIRSWRNYSLLWKLRGSWGFGIGPILIWDGK
jgi:hypothetical protein